MSKSTLLWFTRLFSVTIVSMFVSCLFVIVIGNALMQNTPHVSAALVSTTTPLPFPTSEVQGVPAISVSQSTNSGTSTGSVPISIQDVQGFVAAQDGIFHAKLIGKPNIASIQLLSGGKIDSVLPIALNLPPSKMYYLVILNNKAIFSGTPGNSITTQRVYEVFDALNGNLMSSGGLAH